MAADPGAPTPRSRANRLAGAALALTGLAAVFVIIPAHTETVGYGWLRPATLPTLAAALTGLAGLALALRPRGTVAATPRAFRRAATYLALAAAALWAMTRLGYLAAMPPFALAVMLLAGERRPLWLAAGAGVLPLALWAVTVHLLGRPLP